MSLYLKYRPDSLDTVKGNTDIVPVIEKMVSNIESCPHVFLLHGPTGCGKTTIGRIIVNMLGCVGSDFREIDSADFRGIDTVREVRKNSLYKPLEGSCRVWLIDECHKMTGDAQNALLKILEDTPPHVYFILCTTEPAKLIPAIKGRCQQFEVKPLNDSQLYGLLRKIVKQEGDSLDKEIYDQIILDSRGHPRNAIQILEQVLAADPEQRIEIAKQAAAEQSEVIELCRALIGKQPWGSINKILTGLKQKDPEEIRRIVLGYAQAILLNKDETRAAVMIECFYEPTYNIGFPGVVFACYQIYKT